MKKSEKFKIFRTQLITSMLAAILLLGGICPALASNTQTGTFSDTPRKEMSAALSALRSAGIVTGVSADSFAPDQPLDWAAFLTMLGRAAKAQVNHAAAAEIPGVINDGWSSGYIAWAFENGLLDQNSTIFSQHGEATQEQVNMILTRYNSKFENKIGLYPAPAGIATRGNFALLLAGGAAYKKTDSISVSGGQICGYLSPDTGVEIYKGIPYAAPPTGELRWKAPQPVKAWSGVRSCVNWSASAIQDIQEPFMMWTEEFVIEDTGYSEDCLYLNVWTSGRSTANKPVLVYIHGGALTSGGASCEVYDGEYMAQQDVVYVSINYRVGVLGYLATSALSAENENGVSGNYGLLDQIAALRWVNENIAAFGGDPNNVTIMGQSAGSASVHALIQSPLAKGLFQKAATLSFNSMTESLIAQSEKLEAANDELFANYTLEELRKMPTSELMKISNDGSLNIDGYVLPKSYAEMVRNGEVNDVTLLSGMATGDTMLLGLISSFDISTVDAYEKSVRDAFGEFADQVLEMYPATEGTLEAVIERLNVDNMIALQSILTQARKLGGYGDTYVYMFDRTMPGVDNSAFGAFHTADVPYFLNILSKWRAEYWTDIDRSLAKTMSNYLLNFVRDGNPNGAGLPKWEVSTGNGHYQALKETCGDAALSQEKMDLFSEIYSNLLK